MKHLVGFKTTYLHQINYLLSCLNCNYHFKDICHISVTYHINNDVYILSFDMLMSRKNISGFKMMRYICFDIYPDHRKNCHPIPIAHKVGDYYIFPAAVGDYII